MIPVHPRTRSRFSPLLLALALAACTSTDPPKVDENAFPTDYRKAVLTHVMTTQSFDPTNIRDASISEPELKPVVGNTTRYVVCVRFNARNEQRQYAGLRERVAYFYAGDLNQFQEASAGQCAGAAYKPFPELEKICLSEKDKCV